MSSQNWKRVIVPGQSSDSHLMQARSVAGFHPPQDGSKNSGAQQPAFLKIRNKGEKRGQAVHIKKAMLLIQLQ
ncbi:hypothetical protein ILYODFUR_019989 [Ilyodon furcidens]|uniref:Uncharacterized protein n=2 Tax=Goodeidae TaxID=28758 RepID=A0ABV0TMX4_9TELE